MKDMQMFKDGKVDKNQLKRNATKKMYAKILNLPSNYSYGKTFDVFDSRLNKLNLIELSMLVWITSDCLNGTVTTVSDVAAQAFINSGYGVLRSRLDSLTILELSLFLEALSKKFVVDSLNHNA